MESIRSANCMELRLIREYFFFGLDSIRHFVSSPYRNKLRIPYTLTRD